MIGKQHNELQHAFHIVTVVKNQQFVKIIRWIFHISMIDINELAAVIFIFPADAEKTFQCFLLAVGRVQKKFVR